MGLFIPTYQELVGTPLSAISAQPSVLSREPWPLAKLREWLTLRQKFNINLFGYNLIIERFMRIESLVKSPWPRYLRCFVAQATSALT
ncbi:MAG: hypothetical protein F6J94_26280 [Moorea sp. SIO1F2]|uniref:hypothetical protein n=1 Tax=unclassified Moorena TaxID=2683338 RepID=UPI0013BA496D|nr:MULTISPECIES: hypothetical protein [unclassified Moorena]NEO66150.1 hypothetical protein [Moorena sp. SIO4G2]NEO11868.1 hypothetical protein [Moorena sp. SIO3E8]NEP22470.1 hypothetical protein [Moorena sp. SIO3I6]NEP98786.1 hypothetical protein [Moorena sp. SIO3F7]NET85288.1 hypothetical protein [Moorena sp. SIO1F2]